MQFPNDASQQIYTFPHLHTLLQISASDCARKGPIRLNYNRSIVTDRQPLNNKPYIVLLGHFREGIGEKTQYADMALWANEIG